MTQITKEIRSAFRESTSASILITIGAIGAAVFVFGTLLA